MRFRAAWLISIVCFSLPPLPQVVSAQENATPIATTWLEDAAGPAQRKALSAVLKIECNSSLGTGFVLKAGLVVTNVHVVQGCEPGQVIGKSAHGEVVRFDRWIKDADRDLAVLRPTRKLKNGLDLGQDQSLTLGRSVTSYGFPLIYSSGAPVLSVGYVAGFNDAHAGTRVVKHIIVNGAYNPGNSGGPVFLSGEERVVGIVVWKQLILPPEISDLISGLEHPTVGFSSGQFTKRLPNGQVVPALDGEVTAAILRQFYNTVQVMIGEAISVSELSQFLTESGSKLQD